MCKKLGVLLLAAGTGLLLLAAAVVPARTTERYVSRQLAVAQMTTIVLPTGEIDVNHADVQELDRLPGVGEATALLIIAEREAHGAFYYPEDLICVKGISEKKLAQMTDMLHMSEAVQ